MFDSTTTNPSASSTAVVLEPVIMEPTAKMEVEGEVEEEGYEGRGNGRSIGLEGLCVFVCCLIGKHIGIVVDNNDDDDNTTVTIVASSLRIRIVSCIFQ